jgi:hypothetical protein
MARTYIFTLRIEGPIDEADGYNGPDGFAQALLTEVEEWASRACPPENLNGVWVYGPSPVVYPMLAEKDYNGPNDVTERSTDVQASKVVAEVELRQTHE